jgi:glucose/arabinose dehydrogenase
MRLKFFATTALTLSLVAACSAASPTPVESPAGPPVETRPATANQSPAFEGQTRAPGMASAVTLRHTVVAEGLEHPWGLALMPDGRWLVTERMGKMSIIAADGTQGPDITGLPAVDNEGQGGLLGVTLSPSFTQDRMVYWTYAEPRTGGNGTAVARGVLSADGARMEQVQVLFRALPTFAGRAHYGSAIAFGPDGKLYVTLGERSSRETRPLAQDLNSHLGKIIRINADGSVPEDNPYVGRADAKPEIWTWGHRHPQGLVFSPEGKLWAVEHGANGGDEVNLIERGSNYGWPDAAYGLEYSGDPIGPGNTQKEGTVQPVYFWDPVIAASGATLYKGAMFPGWEGNLLVAGLAGNHVARLVIKDNRVVGEERLLFDLGERIRNVAVGPDGAVWVVTDDMNGKLVRLAKAD